MTSLRPHDTRLPSQDPPQPRSPDPARMIWLMELMGRYAREKLETDDSPRLAAAIVIHLRAMHDEVDPQSAHSSTVDHWLEMWEAILERALTRRADEPSESLFQLVRRARLCT